MYNRRSNVTAPFGTLCLLLVTLSGPAARAMTIDFEDVAVPSGTGTTVTLELISGGFSFSFFQPPNLVDHGHLMNDEPGRSSNGTTWLGLHESGDPRQPNIMTMTVLSGGTFSLREADFAEFNATAASAGTNADTVRIEGFLSGGGSLVRVVNLDGVADGIGSLDDFQSETFSTAWTSLASVTFEGIGGTQGAWGIDTIVVPEPAVPLLLATACFVLSSRRARLEPPPHPQPHEPAGE